MEAIKIVSQLEDGTDNIELFGGFDHVIVRRGVWLAEEDAPVKAKIGNYEVVPDKVIFAKGDSAENGSRCKEIKLEKPNSFLVILTDARVFVLGKNGKTLEAIY